MLSGRGGDGSRKAKILVCLAGESECSGALRTVRVGKVIMPGKTLGDAIRVSELKR